ncbi:hypothetical protein [Brevundimonas sp. Leaf363]|uniref:hypothetical protein n=1 Tax=Brevundimonas sp. Leaf363 TaxID=1736353 RepID=UPI000A51CC86|nr:hypothetical protein [Brevundimonas sp. Leaf363]
MAEKQTDGREKNGAMPVEAATPSDSAKAAKKSGKMEQSLGGPDAGPAREVGDTFKRKP